MAPPAADPALPPDVVRVRVVVRGHVQGVCFRADARERARSLGVAGWVRNTPDGSVEAVLEGLPDRVESLLHWCERGPSGACVQEVAVEWEEPRGDAGFFIR